MTLSEFLQTVTAVGVGLGGAASFAAFVVGLRNHDRIKAVQDATNGITEKLVRATGEAEHAKGLLAGVEQEQNRANGADLPPPSPPG